MKDLPTVSARCFCIFVLGRVEGAALTWRHEYSPRDESLSTHRHKSQAKKVVHDPAPLHGGLCSM